MARSEQKSRDGKATAVASWPIVAWTIAVIFIVSVSPSAGPEWEQSRLNLPFRTFEPKQKEELNDLQRRINQNTSWTFSGIRSNSAKCDSLGVVIGDQTLDHVTDNGNYTTNNIKITDLHARGDVWLNHDSSATNAVVYFMKSDGTYESLVWHRTSEEFILSDDLEVSGTLIAAGKAVQLVSSSEFSGIKYNSSSTRLEFYIQDVLVGYIGTDGAYVDNVP